MSNLIARAAMVGIAGALLPAGPANACLGQHSQGYVYLPTLPKAVPEGAVVLKVASEVEVDQLADSVELTVVEVLSGSFSGTRVRVELPSFSTCSNRAFRLPEMIVVGLPSALTDTIVAVEFRWRDLEDKYENVEILEHGAIRIKLRD